jgi:sodium-dependent dicarboxylate transporter 2/3/5
VNVVGESSAQKAPRRLAIVGLVLGPLLFAATLLAPLPANVPAPAVRLLALILLMATWWTTEAVPLAATSLLPVVLLPLLGIMKPEAATAPYADPTIFLFLGGFFLARAFEEWGLHRRVALVALSLIGTQPRRLLLGTMVATAAISMWVSNTATTMMMLPIGLAVASRTAPPRSEAEAFGFNTVLMLAITYAASIGGIATLIGTPPNLIFAGQVKQLVPELGDVGFMRWMVLGFPLAAVYLILAWLFLAFVLWRPAGTASTREGREALMAERAALPPMSRGEVVVVLVFFLTVAAWVFRVDLPLGVFTIPGWSTRLGLQVHDGVIAIAAAIALFIVPVDLRRRQFALDWNWAARIPWDVLLLFGGGFALAAGFRETGFDRWLAGGFAALALLPPMLMIFLLCVAVIAASEIASNTALTILILPVLAATAKTLDLHPYLLMLPATLAASCGFMLPVATPPNAVAVASGYVTPRHMLRAGLPLDLLGALLITLFVWLLGRRLFGLP